MARIAPLPKFRWTESDGTPLANGTVDTYITATSTPKTTYTDRGAGTPNANPVLLDSNGEANIWLDTDARYRFVIKDSTGTTLATIDDITYLPEPADFTGLVNIVEDLTPQLGANLDVNGKNIVSISNGDITLAPNGTGTVIVNTDLDVDNLNVNGNTISSISGAVNITPVAGSAVVLDTSMTVDGGVVVLTGDLSVDNVNINGNTIISTDTGGDLNLTPDTTGDLVLDGLKWPQADGTANQIIETDGAGQLSFVAKSNTIVQIVNTQDGAVSTGTTTMPQDDTIPQNTEGDEYMTLAITPTNSSNKLKIEVIWAGANSATAFNITAALFQDSTAGALACTWATVDNGGYGHPLVFTHYMTAGTASATTFKVRAGAAVAGTTTFNGTGGTRLYGGVVASSITITEIAV